MTIKQRADKPKYKICYCIPVMNRKEDIEATLAHNILEAAAFDNVAIVVHCFDRDSFNLARQIISEVASFHDITRFSARLVEPLPFWHFCLAKNSFLGDLNADYYSSLDGDNFLSRQEICKTIDYISNGLYQSHYLIHHFSGQWGDGTSGRITIPAYVYQDVRYNSRLFSRQFDEIGLLSEALLIHEKTVLVSNQGVDLRSYSGHFRDFCNRVGISDQRFLQSEIRGTGDSVNSPLNPRGKDYVNIDKRLVFFQSFNSMFSFYSACNRKKISHADHYLGRARDAFERGIDLLLREASAWNEVFLLCTAEPSKSQKLTLFSVIKNDSFYLEEWYKYYKSIGIERFIIVDDYSDIPIQDVLRYDDVFVFRPRIGDFKSLKVKWIQLLMARYQVEGSWVITVDADEMIDPVSASLGLKDLTSILEYAEKNQLNSVGGILCEMLPPEGTKVEHLGAGYSSRFRYVYLRARITHTDYKSKASIKWAFAGYWPLSYMFDYRFRVFGTVDSLRKIPILRYSKDTMLNQGFHVLRKAGVEKTAREFFSSPIVPIKHFKSIKVYADDSTNLLAANKDSYFSRTAHNLEILANAPSEYIQARNVTPFVREYNSHDVSATIERIVRDISEGKFRLPLVTPTILDHS